MQIDALLEYHASLSTNDVDAFESSNLHEWNTMLPLSFHWNSDLILETV
jgi:hypothetical protein